MVGLFSTALLAYALSIFFFILQAWKIQRITDILPSISWLGFVAFPFSFAILPFAQDSAALTLHITGICILGFALLAADVLSMRKLNRQDLQNKTNGKTAEIATITRIHDGQNRLLFFCALTSFTICLAGISGHIHRIGVENIPFFQSLIAENMDSALIEKMRDSFSREATLTIFEKYFYSFNVIIFGLPPLIYFIITKRFILAFNAFSIYTTYLLASTANMPYMIFVAIFLLTMLHITLPKFRNHILALGIIGAFTLIIIGSAIRIQFPQSFINEAIKGNDVGCSVYLDQSPKFCDLDTTMGDYYRLPANMYAKRTTPIRLFDYGLYRMLITPIDVSYRWYQYYKEPENRVSYTSIIPQWREEGFVHPARQVTTFAYESRFPKEYNGFAYGSIDADAFARGGLWSVGLIAFLLMIIRMIPAYLHSNNPYSEIYNLMLIALLVILLPSASLQALLVAHGLLPLCGIVISLRIFKFCVDYRYENKDKQRTMS